MKSKLERIFMDSFKKECSPRGQFVKSELTKGQIEQWNNFIHSLGCKLANRQKSVKDAVEWTEKTIKEGNYIVDHPTTNYEMYRGPVAYIIVPEDLALKILTLGYI